MRTMKIRCILALIAAIAAYCLSAPPSFACSQPTAKTITYSWPPNLLVYVNPGNVPSGPVTTAVNNWNNGFATQLGTNGCAPLFSIGSGGSSWPTITMTYGPLPDQTPCPAGMTCPTRGQTNFDSFSGGRLYAASITINSSMNGTAAITEVVAHEMGHTMSLNDCNCTNVNGACTGCPIYSSVMEAGAPTSSINGTIGQPGPTPCDITAVIGVAKDYVCSSPPPPPRCCKCGGPPNAKGEQSYNKFFLRKVQADGCQQGYSTDCCYTPVIIDTSGNGFVLTSLANGVKFDISGAGAPVQISWTAPGSGNAFLCLPDANGACDDGKDLFGSITPQPASSTPNGFAALGVYDQPANGGNGDGIIDSRDAIFSSLRLWIDANHDGISQPNEIFTLPQLGITSIGLNYKLDQRRDQYGNIFRYRAQVGSTSGAGRMAYDVFFVTEGATTTNACTLPGIIPEKDGRLK